MEGGAGKRMPEESMDLSAAEEILRRAGLLLPRPPVGPARRRALERVIPILQEIQETYGYLPEPVIRWVGDRTGIPLSRLYGIVTFYSQFHLEPRGKHMVKCCRGTACHVKGGKAVASAITDHLGVKDGGTTPDGRFTYETVQCVGTCFLAPVVMVDDDYHGELTRDGALRMLGRYSKS